MIDSFDETDTKLPALVPAAGDDGWEEMANEQQAQMLSETLIKFADWRWTKGKSGEAIPEDAQFVVTGSAAAWVKWVDGKPSEYRRRRPGKPMPDRNELPDQDEMEWQHGPDGKPRDPWQDTRFVYLLDPVTAEAFTFSTSSWGGRDAVLKLADQIVRMRQLGGRAGAMPVVVLASEKKPTKYGVKSRPVFKVIKWFGGSENGGAPREISPPSPREISAAPPDDDAPAFDSAPFDRDQDDIIPF